MECTITTPEELVFDGAAKSVIVPGVDGEMGFLSKHAALVSTLGHGELRVEPESGGKQRCFVSGGCVQVLDDRVTVLAVDAVAVDALDAKAEQEALDKLNSERGSPSTFEERQEHQQAIDVQKLRVRLASR